jgi:hypothetical protein
MRKILTTAPILIAGSILLTGCGAESVVTNMKVHDTEKVSVTMDVGYAKDTDVDDINDSLNMVFKTSSDEKVKIKDYSSDEYTGKTYSWNKVSLNEFENSFDIDNDEKGTIQDVSGRYVVSLPYTDTLDGFDNSTFTVEMPGKITNAPGATVDGNKATWNLRDFEGSEMVLESEKSNPTPFVIAGTLGLLAAGAGFFYYRSRKVNNDTAHAQENTHPEA